MHHSKILKYKQNMLKDALYWFEILNSVQITIHLTIANIYFSFWSSNTGYYRCLGYKIGAKCTKRCVVFLLINSQSFNVFPCIYTLFLIARNIKTNYINLFSNNFTYSTLLDLSFFLQITYVWCWIFWKVNISG